MAGKYFDDYGVGEEFITPSRTITETDIVLFAGLTSDYNAIHTDQEYASQTSFGGRIAHGLLTLSISMGLISRLGLSEGTIVALVGLDDVKFTAPVKIGDTIRCKIRVTEKRNTSNPEHGLVTFKQEVLNQADKVVLQFERKAVFLKRSLG